MVAALYLLIGFVVAVWVEMDFKCPAVSLLLGAMWPLVLTAWAAAWLLAGVCLLVETSANLVKRLLSGKTDKGPVSLRKIVDR